MQSNRLCNFFTLPGNYNLDMKVDFKEGFPE
ncbi:Hypothetical protein DPCES_1776 [Desulfitobacterium hafniense]|uniref:Uncharacterized protein n=1 Tax=Desulfitobacterium hafniense TaxID=49338 RepID=A0A098AYG4_DESHA|nr:Hypothetical protein DPCES_1776 [Desulfitobacterium hafniense]